MATYPGGIDRAVRTLERRMLARRWAMLALRTRVLLALLAVNVMAFAYWQARVPLDGLRHRRGTGAAALAMAGALAAIALLGAAIAAWRRAAIAGHVPGPEWLALPLPPARVGRHLRMESSWPAAAVLPAALAVLLAGHGLLAPAWLAAFALGFLGAWLAATRAAIAIARRATLPRRRGGPGLPADTRALLAAARGGTTRALPPPRWRGEPAWRALARLDALLTRRRSAARTRLVSVVLCAATGLAAWFLPAPVLVRRALAFLAFIPACASLGAWAIARTCADPAGALRPLPLGLSDLWRARGTFVTVIVATLVAANVALALGLPAGARVGLALTWLPAGLAVAALGLLYALTLAPRATAAENLYYGWLAVALVASWMIPLLGWFVLLAGLVHAGVRLPRWWRPEVG